MSTLKARISKLEKIHTVVDDNLHFTHITFVQPGDGPEAVQALCVESRLYDGQVLRSTPGESIEDFKARILESDTERKPGFGYRIIDVTECSAEEVMEILDKCEKIYDNPIHKDMSPKEASRIYCELIKNP